MVSRMAKAIFHSELVSQAATAAFHTNLSGVTASAAIEKHSVCRLLSDALGVSASSNASISSNKTSATFHWWPLCPQALMAAEQLMSFNLTWRQAWVPIARLAKLSMPGGFALAMTPEWRAVSPPPELASSKPADEAPSPKHCLHLGRWFRLCEIARFKTKPLSQALIAEPKLTESCATRVLKFHLLTLPHGPEDGGLGMSKSMRTASSQSAPRQASIAAFQPQLDMGGPHWRTNDCGSANTRCCWFGFSCQSLYNNHWGEKLTWSRGNPHISQARLTACGMRQFPSIKCPSRSHVSVACRGSPSYHAVNKQKCGRPIALRTGRRRGAVADLIRNDL